MFLECFQSKAIMSALSFDGTIYSCHGITCRRVVLYVLVSFPTVSHLDEMTFRVSPSYLKRQIFIDKSTVTYLCLYRRWKSVGEKMMFNCWRSGSNLHFMFLCSRRFISRQDFCQGRNQPFSSGESVSNKEARSNLTFSSLYKVLHKNVLSF